MYVYIPLGAYSESNHKRQFISIYGMPFNPRMAPTYLLIAGTELT